MSKPKAPAPPDPYQVAGAQSQQNQDAALFNAVMNRMNTYTPFGSQEFNVSGTDPRTGAPIYEQRINLSDDQQQLFDQQQQQNLQLGDIAGGMMNQVSNSYQNPFSYGDIGELRTGAQDSLYDMNAAYLDQQFSRGEDSLRTRLANQGVVEGTEAYSNAMQDFNQGKEMAYRQARNSAVTGAGAESDRMLQQAMAMRNQPLNEFNALRTASPVSMPQFGGPTQVGAAPADIAGAMYNQHQGQMNAYNAQQQGRNNLMGGLFGLGSAAIMMSDERVKDDIEHVGELDSGDSLYLFRYKGDDAPHVGVMAQEVEKKDPGAVSEIHGIKHVDYKRVLARALSHA